MAVAEPRRQVALGVIGCGYMGGTAIRAFDAFRELATGYGVSLDLKFVIEPNRATFLYVADYCHTKFSYSPRCAREWEQSVAYLRHDDPPLIVYDASPPFAHFSYYSRFNSFAQRASNKVVYIGEKPLFFDRQHLTIAGHAKLLALCDLIETVNPVVVKVQEYIRDNDLRPQRMYFWRAGSSGLKIVSRCNRDGVQGGALLDKAPHDLAISQSFLDPETVRGRARSAEIYSLIPAPGVFSPGDRRELIDARNRPQKAICDDLKKRLMLPADGLSSVEADWEMPGSATVPAKYLFSWIGVTGHPSEDIFVERLESLGLSPQQFIRRTEDSGPRSVRHPLDLAEDDKDSAENGPPALAVDIEEIRVGILEFEDRTIVCNFLGKGGLARFATVFFRDGSKEDITREDEAAHLALKQQELAQVLGVALKECIGAKDEERDLLTQRLSLETHRLMLDAQDAAIRSLGGSFDAHFETSLALTKEKVRKL